MTRLMRWPLWLSSLSVLVRLGCCYLEMEHAASHLDLQMHNSYYREFTLLLESGSSHCFELELFKDNVFFFEFMVMSTQFSNAQLHKVTSVVTRRLRNEESAVLVANTNDDDQGHIEEHKVNVDNAIYQICIWGRFPDGPARVFVEINVEGLEDPLKYKFNDELSNDNDTARMFEANVSKTISTLEQRLFASHRILSISKAHFNQELSHKMTTSDVIDRWSLIHLLLVVAAAVGQVTLLKRFFETPGQVVV